MHHKSRETLYYAHNFIPSNFLNFAILILERNSVDEIKGEKIHHFSSNKVFAIWYKATIRHLHPRVPKNNNSNSFFSLSRSSIPSKLPTITQRYKKFYLMRAYYFAYLFHPSIYFYYTYIPTCWRTTSPASTSARRYSNYFFSAILDFFFIFISYKVVKNLYVACLDLFCQTLTTCGATSSFFPFIYFFKNSRTLLIFLRLRRWFSFLKFRVRSNIQLWVFFFKNPMKNYVW